MAIRESLLNETVTIFRVDQTATNSIGEISTGGKVTVATGIKCRITNDEINDVGKDKGNEHMEGMYIPGKYIGFFKTGVDVRVGDRIKTSTSRLYYVDMVIDTPGGSSTSHIETRLSDVSLDQES